VLGADEQAVDAVGFYAWFQKLRLAELGVGSEAMCITRDFTSATFAMLFIVFFDKDIIIKTESFSPCNLSNSWIQPYLPID
jgi:hypothetical protein